VAGHSLYFSRCDGRNDGIGRVPRSKKATYTSVHFVVRTDCPLELAAGGGLLYWVHQVITGEPSTIGRATLKGGSANGDWVNTRTNDGPDFFTLDGSYVYWVWGGAGKDRSWIGRVRVNRRAFNRRFLRVFDGPVAVLSTRHS
jgi:hypothetical protein